MSNDIAIKVENLSKCYQIYDKPHDRLLQMLMRGRKQYYKEFWALKDVSFEVKKGESVGILGRNGSGKSTLLQMICGTLSPTNGSVRTQGRIAALLELGSGFNPEFTGRENVYMNGALLGLTTEQVDNCFDAIASFADIGEFIDQPIKTYSSGMLIRLAFAVQVQIEPEILVIDEALSVGDALFQKRCFQRIEKLVSNGTTLLFVSHEQENIRTLTNRALLLNKGMSQSWGLSSEVVLEYRRLLHEEEIAYFGHIANQLTAKSQTSDLNDVEEKPSKNDAALEKIESIGRSNKLSFGDGEIKVIRVETLDNEDKPCSVYYPGDQLKIKVYCEARASFSKINVAVRLRNKEGVKIYSWGTLNQDMSRIARDQGSKSIFWARQFQAGEQFEVTFNCQCSLGVNLYELQASVSFEDTPDYMSQRILHWLDEAAFFQVVMKRDEHFFGGVTDLMMKAEW